MKNITNSEADRLIDEFLSKDEVKPERFEDSFNLLENVSSEHSKMFTSYITRIYPDAIDELTSRGWQIPTPNEVLLKEYQKLGFKPKESIFKRILRKLFKL